MVRKTMSLQKKSSWLHQVDRLHCKTPLHMQGYACILWNVVVQAILPLTILWEAVSPKKYCVFWKFLKSMRITFGLLWGSLVNYEIVIDGEKWFVINFGHVVLTNFFLDPFGPIHDYIKIDQIFPKYTQKYAHEIQEFRWNEDKGIVCLIGNFPCQTVNRVNHCKNERNGSKGHFPANQPWSIYS